MAAKPRTSFAIVKDELKEGAKVITLQCDTTSKALVLCPVTQTEQSYPERTWDRQDVRAQPAARACDGTCSGLRDLQRRRVWFDLAPVDGAGTSLVLRHMFARAVRRAGAPSALPAAAPKHDVVLDGWHSRPDTLTDTLIPQRGGAAPPVRSGDPGCSTASTTSSPSTAKSLADQADSGGGPSILHKARV